jgi:hypothetical protein
MKMALVHENTGKLPLSSHSFLDVNSMSICVLYVSNGFLTCILSINFCLLSHSVLDFFFQGIKEGWYDGASIAFAVILVIVVTGMEIHV